MTKSQPYLDFTTNVLRPQRSHKYSPLWTFMQLPQSHIGYHHWSTWKHPRIWEQTTESLNSGDFTSSNCWVFSSWHN